jgi:glucan biosynthesis protein C
MSDQIQSKPSQRIYYLDYLRAFIVFVVIVLHSLLPYVIGYDWTINDSIKSVFFSNISTLIDVFIMPIMFFIAGYFAFPSIRKGVKDFIKNKVTRIALPYLFGILFLAPIISYLGLIQHSIIDMSYYTYYTTVLFNNPINSQHFWFLSSLFLFFMVFTLVYVLFKDILENIYEKAKTHTPSNQSILIFIGCFLALSIGLFYLVGRVFPDGSWNTVFIFFSFQLTRWSNYILYFGLGILVFIKRINIAELIKKSTFAILMLAFMITYLFLNFKYSVYWASELAYTQANVQFYNAIVHVLYCFTSLLTLLFLFQYLNRPSKMLQRLAKNSFTIYLVHMVYTVIIQFYIVNLQMDIYLKFIITTTGTLILSIATAELLSYLNIHVFHQKRKA